MPSSYYNPRGVVINHMYRVPVVVEPNGYRAEREQTELQKARNQYYKPGENPHEKTGQEFPNKPTGGVFREPWVHDRRQ